MSELQLLLLCTSDSFGGMERIVVNLARELTSRGWLVRSVFPCSPNSAAFVDWCCGQGVTARPSPALLPVTSQHTLRQLLALRRLIRSHRPALVNLHYGSNFISLKDVLAVRLAGSRCFISIHLPVSWGTTGVFKRWMTRLAASLAEGVIANSRATQRVLLDAGVSEHKVHVIPCGVRIPAHLPDKLEARARLGIPPKAFVVGSHARLVKIKGLRYLIEAVAQLPEACGEVHLIIAGDGPERVALEQLATQCLGSRARFLGHIADTADFYAALDVFALPSYMEGFGLVFVEAAFHNVPSIGTKVGGVPDAIVDGVTGLLIPPGDPHSLAVAIHQLRMDAALREQFGHAARIRALSMYTDRLLADRYERVLAGR